MRKLVLLVLACTLCGACATPMTKEQSLAYGSFEVVKGSTRYPGVVLAAPHGTGDCNTGVFVKNLAIELGIAGVIASRFTRKETGDYRINVNRPTEGAGLSPGQELHTPRAAHVWAEYRRLVLDAAGGRLALYIEIHCNNHPPAREAIEVATVGVSYSKALELKRLYGEARDRAVTGQLPRAGIRMEPVDAIYFGAGGAKKLGSLGLSPVSIHVELPEPVTRHAASGKDPYGKVLAAFILAAIAEAR
jgi:hypothetical protein